MSVDYVADVGNTAAKWAGCSGGAVGEVTVLPLDDRGAWLREIPPLSHGKDSNCWAIAGSNPAHRDRLALWLSEHRQKVVVIKDRRQLPIRVEVPSPEKVGIDRLLNAVAVNSRRPAGQCAVIVDVGSAVTADLVDHGGAFQGGAIFPGLAMMSKALHDHTAMLPEVRIDGPQEPPGKVTEGAIAVGVFHAVAGGIQTLIQRYLQQVGGPMQVYLGGGDGRMLAATLAELDVILWPEMTLEGLRLSSEHV